MRSFGCEAEVIAKWGDERKHAGGGGDEMNENVSLEAIIAENSQTLQLSELDYFSVLEEARSRAAGLGWQVMVVDFGDPDNLYTKPYNEMWELYEAYARQRILFFHHNIASGDSDMVQRARGHIDESVTHYDESGEWKNMFIATFDNIPEEAHMRFFEADVSSYFSRWGRRLTSDKEKYVNSQREAVEELLQEYLNEDGEDITAVINLVGKEGTGKTSLLIVLAHLLSNGHSSLGRTISTGYFTMQSAAGMADADVFSAIYRRTMGTREVAIIDEADNVSPALHGMLAASYRVIVYGSHRELSFPNSAVVRMQYPAGRG